MTGLCQQLIGMGFALASLEESLTAEHRPDAEKAVKLSKLLDEGHRRGTSGLPRALSRPAQDARSASVSGGDGPVGASERYGVHCVCEPRK